MQALLAWYQDVLADPTAGVSPPKPPATPFGKLQLNTPVKMTRSTAAVVAASSEVSPTGSVTSPLAKMGINTPKAKGRGKVSEEEQASQACGVKKKVCTAKATYDRVTSLTQFVTSLDQNGQQYSQGMFRKFLLHGSSDASSHQYKLTIALRQQVLGFATQSNCDTSPPEVQVTC